MALVEYEEVADPVGDIWCMRLLCATNVGNVMVPPSDNILRFRRHNYSQEELAKRMGCNRATVNRIETGRGVGWRWVRTYYAALGMGIRCFKKWDIDADPGLHGVDEWRRW